MTGPQEKIKEKKIGKIKKSEQSKLRAARWAGGRERLQRSHCKPPYPGGTRVAKFLERKMIELTR